MEAMMVGLLVIVIVATDCSSCNRKSMSDYI
jgi:hypothetical protein